MYWLARILCRESAQIEAAHRGLERYPGLRRPRAHCCCQELPLWSPGGHLVRHLRALPVSLSQAYPKPSGKASFSSLPLPGCPSQGALRKCSLPSIPAPLRIPAQGGISALLRRRRTMALGCVYLREVFLKPKQP